METKVEKGAVLQVVPCEILATNFGTMLLWLRLNCRRVFTTALRRIRKPSTPMETRFSPNRGEGKMDREKFKKLVHYVCWRCGCDPSKLGAVKLNKILWLSELSMYYTTGQSITSARYVKRQRGPVPAPILPILNELKQEGVLTIRETEFHGFKKREFIVNKDANGEFLSQQERELVEETIAFVCEKHTAKSIS